MKLFYIFVLLNLFSISVQDLPVHCLSAHIEGDWLIHMGENDGDVDLKCGHNVPDGNLDHYNVDVESTFATKYESLVILERPNYVYSIKDKKTQLGKWTMVYDEGFEFTLGNFVFFAFSRYMKVGKFNPSNSDTEETPGYKNICDKTFIGWYHNRLNNKEWGCFWAEKVKGDLYDINNINYSNIHSINKLFIKGTSSERRNNNSNGIKNSMDSKDFFNSINTPTKAVKKEDNLMDLLFSMSENKDEIVKKEKSLVNKNVIKKQETTSQNHESNSYLDFIKSLGWDNSSNIGNFNNIPHLDIYFLTNKETSNGNFLEVETKSKLFTPDIEYVNRINNPNNGYLWKAKVYDDFIGKSYSQMRTLLGSNNYRKNIANSFLELSIELSTENKNKGKSKNSYYSELPKIFDWRSLDGANYDSPIRKQGECGSCYAIAAVSVIETRIRIKSNNRLKPILSPASVISCSRINQGCSGGYPYLVGKYGKEIGFVEDNCQPYTEQDDKCFNYCFHQKTWKVKDYGYVGGYYGGCDEQSMMREIYENGPIVVAINATPELYYYSTGIFHSEAKKTDGKAEKMVNPWEYTNHAVVCIGWGEEIVKEETVKYWILKNSWGDTWGEKGYFRMERGTDMASVEAQGVYLSPDLD